MDSTTAMDLKYAYESRSDDEYDEDAPPVPTKAEAAARRRAEREAMRAARLAHLGANQAVRQQANKDKVVERARGGCYIEPTDQLIDKRKGTLPVITIKQAPVRVVELKRLRCARCAAPFMENEKHECARRIRRHKKQRMEEYEPESDDDDSAPARSRYDAVRMRLARGPKEHIREWVLRESGAPR